MLGLRRFGDSVGKEVAISFATQVQSNPFAAAMSIDGVCGVLQDVATEHGLQYFSYLQLNGAGRCTRLVANYPQEWRKRYEDKLYIHYDPVVAVGRKSRLPFFWNNSSFIQPYRKAQQKVFYEAGNYGINFGYSIPIAGKGGECGLFSIVARQEGALVDVLSTCAHPVYLLGLQLHDHVSSMTGELVRDEPDVDLTARELECLKWAAEGLTTEQIADRLSLSAATVNYHFNKIVFKFSAANRHHAAIKAVRMGII